MTRKYSVLLTLVAGLFMTANANAQYSHIIKIKGSLHDLSSNSSSSVHSTTFTEICYFCHTPHISASASSGYPPPLWNHTLSTVTTYGTYSSPSFTALTGLANLPDLGATNNPSTAVISNLCLSCHDGTVGVNQFNTGSYQPSLHSSVSEPAMSCGQAGAVAAGSACTMQMAASYAVVAGNPGAGMGLTSVHPINFTYNAALAAQTKDLVTPTTSALAISGSTLGGSATGILPAGGGWLPLYNGTMQCATCHDVHDNTINDFLRTDNSTSGLCLACHGALN
jgi:predicted CXXCH cytochrome family protein